MKNLIETFKDLYKNGAVRILALVVLFLIVAVFVFGANRNPENNRFGKLSYPQNIPGANESVPQITVNFGFDKNINLPKNADVYLIDVPSQEKTTELFNKVSKKLGLTEKPRISADTYQAASDSAVFVGNITTGNFSFSGKSDVRLSEADSFNFLSDLGLTTLLPDKPIVSYYNYVGDELIVSKNKNSSDAVSVSFLPVINSVPIIGLGPAEDATTLYISRKDSSLFKFSFFIPQISTKTKGIYNLKSIEDIKKTPLNLMKIFYLNKGDNDQTSNILPEELSSVNFNSIYLAYYLTAEKSDFLQPIFVLEGKAKTKDNGEGIIKAYLPAIKDSEITPES